MGVLNATPDSFSDGGQFNQLKQAEKRIKELIDQGADIIDIGGESTGPGAPDVSETEELKRLEPIIKSIQKKKWTEKALFSIDTYKAKVADYALENGFQIINDVTALRRDPKMMDILLKHKPYVILMYSKDNTPRTTKEAVEYEDVIDTIKQFLTEKAKQLIQAGFPKEKIILDPGMGAFISANPDYSFEIIERLSELKSLGFPLLVGISRKSCLGGILEERDQPSVEWSLKAFQNGADLIRIHNVKMMKTALGE